MPGKCPDILLEIMVESPRPAALSGGQDRWRENPVGLQGVSAVLDRNPGGEGKDRRQVLGGHSDVFDIVGSESGIQALTHRRRRHAKQHGKTTLARLPPRRTTRENRGDQEKQRDGALLDRQS